MHQSELTAAATARAAPAMRVRIVLFMVAISFRGPSGLSCACQFIGFPIA